MSTAQGESLRRSNPKWKLRLGAIGFGIAIVIAFEFLLRIVGLGTSGAYVDPYVGFSSTRPLFVLNEAKDRFYIPKSRQTFFCPESFASVKTKDEFRIFCLGGSTVQGRPYAIETSFTTWLELALHAADPSRKWNAINCGGVSYASYRLVPIMEEVLAYEPDLLVVYTGHNEFLEDRTYSEVRQTPAWQMAIHERLISLRIYGLARSAALASGIIQNESVAGRPTLTEEVDALLDYQGGLETYHPDEKWKQGVVAHFESNLRRMTRIARNARVPMILVNPVSNMRDTPPFKCELPSDMPADQRASFGKSWNAAKAIDWNQLDAKVQQIKSCLEKESRFADAHFLLAKCREAQERYGDAYAAYLRAKDEDVCPLRILESMHDIIHRVAGQSGIPLVDVRSHFEQVAEYGIPGDDELIDHVHPRIEGHQQIAEILLEKMAAMRFVTPTKGWEVTRQQLYKHHFTTLEPSYFPRSQERLRGLNRWAKGRVERIREPVQNAKE